MPRTTSEDFQAAVKASKQLSKKPDSNDLLSMYGLYKQASQDPPYESAEAPGAFDFKRKAMYKAWGAVKTKTPEQAEMEYITLIEGFKSKYEYDPNKTPEDVK